MRDVTSGARACRLEDVAAQVLVLDDGRDLLADVLGVDDDNFFGAGGGLALDDG